MEDFRHNLTPVEVKVFLQTVAKLTDNLLIRYCYKVPSPCPRCGHQGLCHSGAVSLFSSRLDKVTHDIRACLRCEYIQLATILTVEKL